jgi:hypothetical protein
MTGPEAEERLAAAAAALGEHFDAVQILGSWTDAGHTLCSKKGVGNWYARQGMAHEFINEDVALEQAVAIARRLNPPES